MVVNVDKWTGDSSMSGEPYGNIILEIFCQIQIAPNTSLNSPVFSYSIKSISSSNLFFRDKETFVLAGSTQRSLATKYYICAHFIHPLWNTTNLHSHDFDYQLVLLQNPIPVSANSRPIAIGNVEDIKEGELVSISGWGHTKYKVCVLQGFKYMWPSEKVRSKEKVKCWLSSIFYRHISQFFFW